MSVCVAHLHLHSVSLLADTVLILAPKMAEITSFNPFQQAGSVGPRWKTRTQGLYLKSNANIYLFLFSLKYLL